MLLLCLGIYTRENSENVITPINVHWYSVNDAENNKPAELSFENQKAWKFEFYYSQFFVI